MTGEREHASRLIVQMIIPTLSHFDQSTACKFLQWGVVQESSPAPLPMAYIDVSALLAGICLDFALKIDAISAFFPGIWLWEGARRTNWTSD